jgi:hypothetical protein
MPDDLIVYHVSRRSLGTPLWPWSVRLLYFLTLLGCESRQELTIVDGGAEITATPVIISLERPFEAQHRYLTVCVTLLPGFEPDLTHWGIKTPAGETVRMTATLLTQMGERRLLSGVSFVLNKGTALCLEERPARDSTGGTFQQLELSSTETIRVGAITMVSRTRK